MKPPADTTAGVTVTQVDLERLHHHGARILARPERTRSLAAACASFIINSLLELMSWMLLPPRRFALEARRRRSDAVYRNCRSGEEAFKPSLTRSSHNKLVWNGCVGLPNFAHTSLCKHTASLLCGTYVRVFGTATLALSLQLQVCFDVWARPAVVTLQVLVLDK